MRTFNFIEEKWEAEIIQKRSKFIAKVYPVENKEEVENYLKIVRKEYQGAKHYCFAYCILQQDQQIEKVSDDGEPSGTAGIPILNRIKSYHLCNVLVVVIRYFGGVLLGTGGLLRAYSEVTNCALEKANVIKKELGEEVQVRVSYAESDRFRYYCKKQHIKIKKEEYTENIIFLIEMSMAQAEQFHNNIDKMSINVIKKEVIKRKYISII